MSAKFVMISAKDVKEMQEAQIAEMQRQLDAGEAVENLLGFIEDKIKEKAIAFPFDKGIQIDFNNGIDSRLKDKQIDTIIKNAIKALKEFGFMVSKADTVYDGEYYNDRIYRIIW